MKKRKILLYCFFTLFFLTGCSREPEWKNIGEDVTEEAVVTEGASSLTVYVCGGVVSPGVYTLSEGSRVADALNAAGGMREDAGRETLNLAQPLQDGEMIRVPTVGEEEASVKQQEENGKININTAKEETLTKIPGVGPAKAKAIIQYREEKGRFQKIEDLMQIAGIKESSFQKMKDYVCVN